MLLNDKKIIGQKIKSYRKKRGYTQAELAEKITISEKHLSKIETGLHFPSISAFWNACEVLDIPLSDFGINIDTSTENELREDFIRKIYLLNDSELEYFSKFLQFTLENFQINKKE